MKHKFYFTPHKIFLVQLLAPRDSYNQRLCKHSVEIGHLKSKTEQEKNHNPTNRIGNSVSQT